MIEKEELQRLLELKQNDNIQRFGKLFRTHNGYYFYDTGTSKVIMLDEETYNIVYQLVNEEKLKVEQLLEKMDNRQLELLEEFLEAVRENLLFRAVKLKKLGTDLHGKKLLDELGSNLQQIILEVTGVCNLRCGYCIYNDSYDGNRNFNSGIMSKEVAFKAIDYLAEHGKKEVAVTFYGGEPLLQYILVQECIEYAKEKLVGKEVSFSLTTNLTLMTEERAKYFASVEGMSIVCSLDGPQDVQNSYRKFVGGQGTFEQAFRGLKYLVDAYGEKATKYLSINAVFAPPYTFEKLDEINQFFSDIPWLPDDLRIDITYAADGTVADDENIKELMKDSRYLTEQNTFNPLFLWSREQFLSGNSGGISQSGIGNMLLRVHKRSIYPFPVEQYPFNACCVPGVRRLYVNTEGELYVCERIGNSPSIGNIFHGVNAEGVKKYYVDAYSEHSSELCKNCWAIRLCERCYINNYDKNGYKNENLEKQCQEMQDYVERELAYYHEILETAPEKLEYLNEINVV